MTIGFGIRFSVDFFILSHSPQHIDRHLPLGGGDVVGVTLGKQATKIHLIHLNSLTDISLLVGEMQWE